jgi:excisionase family DNA binding protein
MKNLTLSLRQVRQALGLSDPHMRSLIKDGTLPTTEENRILLSELLQAEPAVAETLLLTSGQVAELLDVVPQTVRNLADRGRLPSLRVAIHRRYRLADVLALEQDTECTGMVDELREADG